MKKGYLYFENKVLKKTRKIVKSLYNRFRLSSFFPWIIALVISFFLIYFISKKYFPDYPLGFFDQIFVEAHGMLFDIIILGIVFTVVNNIREKKLKIQRHEDEIDDFRHWDEKEASYRIVGNIKRLNKLKKYDLNLRHCFLQNANLGNANLKMANLVGADLEGAYLGNAHLEGAYLTDAKFVYANLSDAHLNGAILREAYFNEANLMGAHLEGAIFAFANLYRANLSGAHLKGAYLNGANLRMAILERANLQAENLMGAKLREAKFEGADLEGAKLEGADLENCTISLIQLKSVKSLLDAKMPDGTKYNDNWAKKIHDS